MPDTGPSIDPTRAVSTAANLNIYIIKAGVAGRVEWMAGEWVCTDDPTITLVAFANLVASAVI